MYIITFNKKKIVNKSTLYKYGGNDAEKVLRDNCGFNHANACIKNPCIANNIVCYVLVMHTIIPNRVQLMQVEKVYQTRYK